MEQQAVEAVSIAGSVPADLSIWSLIYKADFIVKLVLLILISASIWSWAIIFDKIKKLRDIAQKTNEFEDKFWSGSSLEELFEDIKSGADHPMALLFVSAMKEWKRTSKVSKLGQLSASFKDRLSQIMRLTISREVESLEKLNSSLRNITSIEKIE